MGDQSELEEIQKRHDASAPFRLPCDTAQLAATSYNQCREDRAKLLSYISAARGKQTRTPGTVEVCAECLNRAPRDGSCHLDTDCDGKYLACAIRQEPKP